jgi:hypothetical protein
VPHVRLTLRLLRAAGGVDRALAARAGLVAGRGVRGVEHVPAQALRRAVHGLERAPAAGMSTCARPGAATHLISEPTFAPVLEAVEPVFVVVEECMSVVCGGVDGYRSRMVERALWETETERAE